MSSPAAGGTASGKPRGETARTPSQQTPDSVAGNSATLSHSEQHRVTHRTTVELECYIRTYVQWNLSIMVTLRPTKSGCSKEVTC